MKRSLPRERWGFASLLVLWGAGPAAAQQVASGEKDIAAKTAPSPPIPLPGGEAGANGTPTDSSHLPSGERARVRKMQTPTALDHSRQPLTTARPDPGLGAGEIRVLVLDGERRPAVGVQVVLASLKSKGSPREIRGATDASGLYTFTGLPAGTDRSYVARVDHQGATYRSPPFYLPVDNGFRVVLHRPDTTRDPDRLLAMSGRAAVELLGEKLRVTVSVRLVNTGGKTYLFPKEGLVMKLPPGFSNLRIPPTMEDRHAVAREGEGVAFFGSIPPGANELAWQFDLPVSTGRTDLAMRLPWPVATFQVVALAVDDLQIDARGAGRAQKHKRDGRDYLVAEIQPGPDNTDVHEIAFSISGLPGPGPLRWAALLLSLLALTVGVRAALRPPPLAKGYEGT